MKILLTAFFLCALTATGISQPRMLENNTPCNHVVVVEWVDMACNHVGFTTHTLNPGMIIMIVGPGGPFSTAFQMNMVTVDNTGTAAPSVVSNPFCGGVPHASPAFPPCAGHIMFNPGMGIVIN